MAEMDDQRAADGVEHLQRAARELLAAARSFLDVVEDVVEDRDRLSGAAASVVDLVRDGVATVTAASSPLQPWETAAWGAPGWDDAEEQDLGAEPTRAAADEVDPTDLADRDVTDVTDARRGGPG